jgi:hypothetical protein
LRDRHATANPIKSKIHRTNVMLRMSGLSDVVVAALRHTLPHRAARRHSDMPAELHGPASGPPGAEIVGLCN